MSDRIIADQDFNTSKMLAQAVHAILTARDQGRTVKAILDHAQSGVPADWASVAAELGLTDKGTYTKAQQALDAWTILSTAVDRINHASIDELTRLHQG